MKENKKLQAATERVAQLRRDLDVAKREVNRIVGRPRGHLVPLTVYAYVWYDSTACRYRMTGKSKGYASPDGWICTDINLISWAPGDFEMVRKQAIQDAKLYASIEAAAEEIGEGLETSPIEED